MIPPLNDAVSADILAAQLDLEHTKSTERERLFLIYAKQWWKEYLEIREEHRTRLVKIFGQVIRRISFARIRSMSFRMKMELIILFLLSFNHFAQVVYWTHHEKQHVL